MGLFEDMLSSGESLIKNEAALDYDFLPKVLPYREREQRRIAEAIKPLFQRRNGRNLFIYGPPGVGKTAAARFVLRELEETTEEVIPLYINCWNANTSHKILLSICEQIGYRFTMNKNTSELMKDVTQIINKNSVVLVLDEVDKVEEVDILYTWIESIYRRSIILITNHLDWLFRLDERIKSRLPLETVEFKQYNKEEIRGILKQRIEYAFPSGVVDESGFEKVVEATVKARDIRKGLFLMREAAMAAEERSSKKINVSDVEKAINKVEDFSIKDKEELDEESKKILEIVNENPGKMIGDLYDIYCKKGGKVSYKTFQRKINSLNKGSFIQLERRTGEGGNTTIINRRLDEY